VVERLDHQRGQRAEEAVGDTVVGGLAGRRSIDQRSA
jgi:hypothetical protein